MSSNSPEAQDLLRLFKCVVDTGADVLVPFAEDKLLKPYNGNFKTFLDDKKHEIFHLWQSKKLLCCECPPAGYNIKRIGHMDNWIFRKIYDDNGLEVGGHIIRNSGKIVQVCIHKYVTKHIGIHELDISVLSCLLRNLASFLPNETTALDTIQKCRSQICHAYAMDCYDITLLNTAWTELENALVDLTDPSYKRVIRKQIKYLRKVDLDKEEITELLKNFEEVNNVLQELKLCSNNNVRHLNGMENRLERMSFNNTEDIKHHTTEQTSFFVTQAQHALSGIAQNAEKLESCIKHEVKEVKESQANSFQNFETQLHETRSEINAVKENQEKTQVEILRAIQNLTLSVKYEKPANLLVPVETYADSMECPVLWQIATPENWNLEEVVATLRNPSNKDEHFKKKFVRKGSLIMLTTIASNILSDSEAFEAAVISFLTKMIEDCDITTEMPGRVDVRLHILNANEVSISCELPLGVLHKEGSGDKKHLKQTEKFDVAFLNGDDEKEIEWIQNISTKLKAKYDIKCTILAKDYLNGFPLKKRLGQYVNMFQAVILTLTMENYKQYDFYIKEDMPVIAVELDYLNEIRSNLRSYPYINCTTCEHLWFPRLVDTLKRKIPDHLWQNMEKDKNKINEDCEKCETTVTTAVYHRVEITTGKVLKRFTLCGSIMDETSISNVLNQMKNLPVPNKITSWKKSLETPLQIFVYSWFILISPNIQKCHSLEKFANALSRKEGIKIHALMVAETESFVLGMKIERPYYIRSTDYFIDATRMNQKEIAETIFVLAKNDDVAQCMITERKRRHAIPVGSFETTKNLEKPNDGMDKFRSGRSVGSIEIKKSLEKPTVRMKNIRSRRSDDFVDKIESLKNAEIRKQTNSTWELDDSVDEIESLKQQKPGEEKDRYLRSDDYVDEITTVKTERAGRSDPKKCILQ